MTGLLLARDASKVRSMLPDITYTFSALLPYRIMTTPYLREPFLQRDPGRQRTLLRLEGNLATGFHI